jgi:aminomethyltransferase
MKEEEYLLVVNASNIEKTGIGFRLKMIWVSTWKTYLMTTLYWQFKDQSSWSNAILPIDLSAIKYYHFEVADFAGLDNVIISATGYTGSGGFKFM